jgi:hypothetical protein
MTTKRSNTRQCIGGRPIIFVVCAIPSGDHDPMRLANIGIGHGRDQASSMHQTVRLEHLADVLDFAGRLDGGKADHVITK